MRLIIFAFLLLSSMSARAYDDQRAKANLSGDLIECYMFYMRGVSITKDSSSKEEAQFQNSANAALQMLLVLRPEKDEAPKIRAQMELSVKHQSKIVDSEGWSRLILDYGDMCKTLLENPSQRIKYWENMKD